MIFRCCVNHFDVEVSTKSIVVCCSYIEFCNLTFTLCDNLCMHNSNALLPYSYEIHSLKPSTIAEQNCVVAFSAGRIGIRCSILS